MVKLMSAFRSLKSIKALVVGDFALDTYVIGSVGRISPEAPVPVLHVKKKTSIPGMAGNVALNLISLGASVKVLGKVGADPEGGILISYLQDHGVDTSPMVIESGYDTPVKKRMIASSQQLLRVDFETIEELSATTEAQIISSLASVLQDIDVVAVSDYKKGFLTFKLMGAIIREANLQKKIVIVDPKGSDFSKYLNCTLIKPNMQEAYLAAQCEKGTDLNEVAKVLLEKSLAKYLLITRSEEGMTLFNREHIREDFSVDSREVKDVTGAGDTVLAVMAMGMGNGLCPSICAKLANIAASLAIQKMGCARITLSQIAEQLFSLNQDSKIFTDEHLFALHQVMQEKTFTVLGLDVSQTMTTELFHCIKQLRGSGLHHRLLIYLSKTEVNASFIDLLTSLHEVSFVVLSSDNLSQLFKKMLPKDIFYMQGDKLSEIKTPLEILDRMLLSQVRS
jgi:D-beta-D-heptose 7-phosphate kinase/D-beta-D-heptose 1-phosphate adenosyltransferase